MAQRKCRDCGELVSINANTCPKCGSTTVNEDLNWPGRALGKFEANLKKYYLIVGAVCLIFGIVAFITADEFMHYIYALLFLAAGVLIGGYPTYYKKKKEKQYEEVYNRVVIK